MKKSISKFLVVVLAFTMLFAVSASAAEAYTFVQVPFAKDGVVTIDGTLAQGEWSETDKITLEAGVNVYKWAIGDLTSPIQFYYSWNEEGILMAAHVVDTTFATAKEDEVSKDQTKVFDRFQIAFNPANIIGDSQPGLFFTFAAGENDQLFVIRHNFEEANDIQNITDKVTKAAYKKTAEGWDMEVLLPWTFVAQDERWEPSDTYDYTLDLTAFNPMSENRSEAYLTATICYVDCDTKATVIGTGRTAGSAKEAADWTVASYNLVLKLNQSGATASEDTAPITLAGGAVTTAAPEDTTAASEDTTAAEAKDTTTAAATTAASTTKGNTVTTNANAKKGNDGLSTTTIIIIVIAAVVVVGGAACVYFFVIKKKK